MMSIKLSRFMIRLLLVGMAFLITSSFVPAAAQDEGPQMLHPLLDVRPVVDGLSSPTTMAFFELDDFLVLEKNTGRVIRVTGGEIQGPVLDLAVNFAAERGLLGIALHPEFPADPGVYLYWTESTTGSDTNVLSNTPFLGNRVDRFIWDGSSLNFDLNLLRIRAIQEDAGQPARGNHNGGVLTFGMDGKLYVFIGDLGRRGHMQNLPCGPTAACPGPTVPDDQFGGPEPDNAHLSGVILRLNADGTTPEDNPFYEVGASIGGEAGANIQKVYSYGHRNSFGMAVDPLSGNLWLQENADDAFSELNLVNPGMNGGWIQVMGPVGRVAQFKGIETTFGGMSLQQIRWPPENIADTPEEALDRLYMLPGAQYKDPEFSWVWEMAPGGIGFMEGYALGPLFAGDLFMGAATTNTEGGYLFRFKLNESRSDISHSDPRLDDRVADNLAKHDITESESLLMGTNFGVATDIKTGPNGNLFIVSLSHGKIYEVFSRYSQEETTIYLPFIQRD